MATLARQALDITKPTAKRLNKQLFLCTPWEKSRDSASSLNVQLHARSGYWSLFGVGARGYTCSVGMTTMIWKLVSCSW
jgi:hypothetical protein